MKRLYAVHFEKDGRECAFGWTENRRDEELVAERIAEVSGVSNVRVEERRANRITWNNGTNAWRINQADTNEYLGQIYACPSGYRIIYRNEADILEGKTFDTLADARYYAERFRLV